MVKYSLVGCSHVFWFEKLDSTHFNKNWDTKLNFGATSMPIFLISLRNRQTFYGRTLAPNKRNNNQFPKIY